LYKGLQLERHPGKNYEKQCVKDNRETLEKSTTGKFTAIKDNWETLQKKTIEKHCKTAQLGTLQKRRLVSTAKKTIGKHCKKDNWEALQKGQLGSNAKRTIGMHCKKDNWETAKRKIGKHRQKGQLGNIAKCQKLYEQNCVNKGNAYLYTRIHERLPSLTSTIKLVIIKLLRFY
jgi:hypothetical protein